MGNNRKRTLMDKQPKGVKPASVHSQVSQQLIDTTMVTIRLRCVAIECSWKSREMEVKLAMCALTKHGQNMHLVAKQYPTPDVQSLLGETPVLPTLKSGVDQAEWNCFVKD